MSRHDTALIDTVANGWQQPALAEARREVAVRHRELLQPLRPTGLTLLERQAVAAFVAVAYDAPEASAHFLGLLSGGSAGTRRIAVLLEYDAALAGGDTYRASPALRREAGGRLAAALELAHLLAFRPAEATPPALRAFVAAGWAPVSVGLVAQIVRLVRDLSQLAAVGHFDLGSIPHPALVAEQG